MKWFKRIAQGFSPHGGRLRRTDEIKLRRSVIFIENPPLKKRQLRRSGILGRVAGPGIFQPSIVRYGRPDVAPTELDAIYLPRCYKDLAPTELFLIKKNFLPNLQKDFSDLHKHESGTC